MKTLPLALVLTLSLASAMLSKAALAETIIDGVVYPEITELGRPRPTAVYTARQVTQLPGLPYTGSRSTTIAPADVAPALTVVSSGGPTVQSVPGYNQAAYGRGYTSVGAPQRVVYVQQAAYSNTVPVQQTVQAQPLMNVQPLTNVQPLGTYAPSATASPGVPWRPVVNIRSMPDNYVVGQGIIGQPKIYVPSQPLRNFIRYITP